MSEALKVLNNIRTLRAQARETDLETLEEMLEKLSVIVDERREEEQAILKEQEQRRAKLEAFRQKLLKMVSILRNYFQRLIQLSLKPNRHALLALLNINIQMIMVMNRLGQVRAALLKQLLLLLTQVKHWKTLPSDGS